MKKTLYGMLLGAALTFSLASCGPKLLTEAEVQAEVAKGFEAGKAAVLTEMNDKCTAEFEARVVAELERIKTEAATAEAASKMPSK